MRVFMPIVLTAIFLIYVLYLVFVKKESKTKLKSVIYPGAFFIVVWGLCYFALVR